LQVAASAPPESTGAHVRAHVVPQQCIWSGQESLAPHAMPSFHDASMHASAPSKHEAKKTTKIATDVRSLRRTMPRWVGDDAIMRRPSVSRGVSRSQSDGSGRCIAG